MINPTPKLTAESDISAAIAIAAEARRLAFDEAAEIAAELEKVAWDPVKRLAYRLVKDRIRALVKEESDG